MNETTATIIDDDRVADLPAVRDGERLLVDAGALGDLTGWVLKPEGLCRGGVCIATALWPHVAEDGRVDLAAFGQAVGRPVLVDAAEGFAVLGTAAEDRAAAMASLDAPELTGTTVDGEQVSLADFRGRKKLLVAFASW